MTARIFARSACVAAAVMLVAGCSSTGEPGGSASTPVATPSPTVVSSAEESTSASDAGGGGAQATLPPENAALEQPRFEDYPGITEETDEGAEQATRFFFDAMYYGYATGDTGPLEAVSDLDSCTSCTDLIDELSSDFGPSRMLATPVKLESIETVVADRKPDGKLEVYYQFERSAFQVKQGSELKADIPTVVQDSGAIVEYTDGQWLISEAVWDDAEAN